MWDFYENNKVSNSQSSLTHLPSSIGVCISSSTSPYLTRIFLEVNVSHIKCDSSAAQ